MLLQKIHCHSSHNSEEHKCLPCRNHTQTYFGTITVFLRECFKFYLVGKRTKKTPHIKLEPYQELKRNNFPLKSLSSLFTFDQVVVQNLTSPEDIAGAKRRITSNSRVKSTSEVATHFLSFLLI